MPKYTRHVWLDWEVEFLRRHYADALTVDLATVLGLPANRILAKANALGLHKSVALIAETARERSTRPDHGSKATRFKPGLVPANKGLRRPGYAPGDMAKTQFRPGNKPHTWVPVGSFRVVPDGQLEQKFSDDPGPPNARWRSYAALVWEAAHGPVQPGHVVAFKPGMSTTDPELVTVDRLECLTRSELMARNTVHAYGPVIASIAQLRGAINRQINKRIKEANA